MPYVSSMGIPRIDVARWPVVVVEWPSGPMTAHELTTHFEQLGALLDARRERCFAILDATNASAMPPLLRSHAAKTLRAFAARSATRIGGVAYVAPTMILRGAITALHWLAPVPFPTVVKATRVEALAWATASARVALAG